MEHTQTEQRKVKRCTTCHLVRPLSSFRRRFAGSDRRHAECQGCANERARLSRLKKRDERLHKFSQTVKERANDAASVAEVTAQMVRLYGGVDQFAVAWKLAIDEAVARGKSYLVVRGFDAVIRLIEAHSEIEKQDDRLERIDNEDLARQFEDVTARVVAGNPELAISAARRLGWEIVPPENSQEVHVS